MTNDESLSPAEQPEEDHEIMVETPELRAWRDRDCLFFRRHQELMRINGVLGFNVSNKPEPITVVLNNTVDLPRVQQEVRELFMAMGLTLDDLRFTQKNPPSMHNPMVLIRKDSAAVPKPKEEDLKTA